MKLYRDTSREIYQFQRKMIDAELDVNFRRPALDQDALLHEFNEILDNLKKDMYLCKVEQGNIRTQLETLRNENKDAGDTVREHFSRIHLESCGNEDSHQKGMILNLQDRIAALQIEKDSVVQLWQVALKAIDVLEEELKGLRTDTKGSQLYEARVNSVKETYSEAIKALELKLLQAKENFSKQQSLWEASKEKIQILTKEKEEIARKLDILQRDTWEKDRNSQQTIESLKNELASAKIDMRRVLTLKSDLEEKLSETKRFAANVMAKDEETKCKMSETLEMVETAVREKDIILHREACVLEEKSRLEQRLAKISDEHVTKLQEEAKNIKSAHERDVNKYLLEIKELKIDLRQKVTLLDRAERECKLMGEELEKVRHGSEDMLHKSHMKVLELQQKLKQTELELQFTDETCKKKFEMEIKHLEGKVTDLEQKLSSSDNALTRTQLQNSNDMEGRVKEANEKVKEMIERYGDLEKRLTKALEDKERLVKEFGILQSSFDREIQKRDHERNLLQQKIQELEANLQKATSATEETLRNNLLARQLYNFDLEIRKKQDATTGNKEHCCQLVLSEHLKTSQEKYDQKIKELTYHVETHQRLSKKWRDEAKSMAARFQVKSKELRVKLGTLKKENDELNKELLACRQQLAEYRQQVIHRYNQGYDTR